jgi:cell wall-associated NlpC family hydrolase
MGTFDRFVGLPYLDKGRDLAGVDCWGLVWMVYRELLGIELPSYSDRYVTGSDRRAIARLIAGELDEWREITVTLEQPFDCVLMREGGLPRHIGIVTSAGMLLHVQPGATSRIERYRHGLIAGRVVGFYRFSGGDA